MVYAYFRDHLLVRSLDGIVAEENSLIIVVRCVWCVMDVCMYKVVKETQENYYIVRYSEAIILSLGRNDIERNQQNYFAQNTSIGMCCVASLFLDPQEKRIASLSFGVSRIQHFIKVFGGPTFGPSPDPFTLYSSAVLHFPSTSFIHTCCASLVSSFLALPGTSNPIVRSPFFLFHFRLTSGQLLP